MQAPKRIALLAASLILLLSLKASASPDTWSHDDAAHLLRRAGFGGTPEQIDRLHALGRQKAVEYLLNGSVLSERSESKGLVLSERSESKGLVLSERSESKGKPTTRPVFDKVDLPAFQFTKEPED